MPNALSRLSTIGLVLSTRIRVRLCVPRETFDRMWILFIVIYDVGSNGVEDDSSNHSKPTLCFREQVFFFFFFRGYVDLILEFINNEELICIL